MKKYYYGILPGLPEKTRMFFRMMAVLLTFTGIEQAGAQCVTANNFSSSVTTGATQATGAWYTDRYAPAGFTSPTGAGEPLVGAGRLKQVIAVADGSNTRPGSYAGYFYNTQGRKLDLAAGTNTIQVQVYIDAAWAGANKRMAGLWASGADNSNAIVTYPILEYTSDGGTPRFRGYDNGTWIDMGIPAGFTSGWATLRIKLMPSGQIAYHVQTSSGSLYQLIAATTATSIANGILQGYNYDPADPNYNATTQTPSNGINYTIYWDNFQSETADITAAVASNNSPVCQGSNAVFNLTGTNGVVLTYNINGGSNTTVTLTGGTATVTIPAVTAAQTLNLVSLYNPVANCSKNISGSSTISITNGPVVNNNTSVQYCTIQSAVNAATAGDVITAAAGTYDEEVTVNKALTIKGNNFGIAGNGTRNAESIISGNNGAHGGFVVTADNVIIDGFTVSGCGGTYGTGVYSSPATQGFTLQNNIISDNVIGAYPSSAGASMVKHNLFDANNRSGAAGGSGIYVEATHNLTIEENEFKNHTTNSAVIFAATVPNAHQNLVFTGNNIHDNNNSSSMVYATNVSSGSFTANMIDGGLRGIKIAGGNSNVSIANNLMSNNGTDVYINNDGTGANSNIQLHENSLLGTIAISNTETAHVDASCNWYGTAVVSAVATRVTGNVAYAQLLNDGTDNNVAAGFQPLPNACVYPVNNITHPKGFATIQAAIDDPITVSGDVIQVNEGTYAERVTVSKSLTLQGDPAKNRNLIILDGTSLSGTGRGIAVNNGIQNVTIKNLTVQHYAGSNGNTDAGIYGIAGNNGLSVLNVAVTDNNNASGFYANGPVENVMIDGSVFSNNGPSGRGVVIWNGLKKDITITNNTVSNNNCCGIELQDGMATGVLVKGNIIMANDNAIGLVGLTSGSALGRANMVDSNTVTVNGRFGMEIKNPDGNGLATGDGAIVISRNTVNYAGTHTDARDYAGIAVMRRGVLAGNVDVPQGVQVINNTVSNFTQPSSSDGFGIVIEGTNHTVTGNTLTGNDVGIQQQAGYGGYPGDGNQADMADLYFGRGNSPATCGNTIASNTFTGNTTNSRNVSIGGGAVVNVNTNKTFCSIQSAINDAATANGHTIRIGAGTYNEQVLVNKSLTLKNEPGAFPEINFSGTVTGKPTLFDVSVDGVTIDSLKFNVDLSRLKSAVIASGAAIDNITVQDNFISGYGTPIASGYGDRNAVSVNYSGSTNYRVASGGVDHIIFTRNIVTANGVSSFRAGIAADEAGGVFADNTLQTINQDIIVRFGSNGDVTLTGNHFNGGGVELAEHNAGAGIFTISNNTFDGTFANGYSSSLRLKNNINGKQTNVTNNTFTGHTWGISMENYRAATIDGNTFTPAASATAFRHVTVNTKLIASTPLASVVRQAVDATITGNTFNGVATATNGKGIAFYNHWNDGGAVYGNFVVGTASAMNTFNEGITNYIFVDSLNALPTNNAAVSGAYPEYAAASAAVSATGYWTKDINGQNNLYVAAAGGTAKSYTAMDFTERYTYLYSHIYDKVDNPAIGRVIFATPVHNITHPSDYVTIQDAIDAAVTVDNDIIVAEAGYYPENITVYKALDIRGPNFGISPNTGTRVDEAIITAPTNNPAGANPNANDLVRITHNDVKIGGFVIDGHSPLLGTSVLQAGGLDIHARRGITNIDAANGYNPVNNLMVQANIIRNVAERGVSLANNGPVSSGNLIDDNHFDHCGVTTDGGQAIILFTNAYADITRNTIDVPQNSIGLHLQNFFQNGTMPMNWKSNKVSVGDNGIGIHANLFYAPAAVLNIDSNEVNAVPSLISTAASPYNWGINIWSVNNGSSVSIKGNNVGNAGGTLARGINLWNNPTTSPVTVAGGSVGHALTGVYASNYDNDYQNAGSSSYMVNGVSIAATAGNGIRIDDDILNTNAATVSLQVSGATAIAAADTGIIVSGGGAALSFNGAAPASFTGQPVYIYEAFNNVATGDAPATPVDATAVTFDGQTGAAASLVQNFNIEDKIVHKIDDAVLGFVKVKEGNTFVTPASFTAATASAKVQRGVDAAATGWTEHVKAGTYADNVMVNKSMTIVGEGPAQTKINSVTTNGNTITVAADTVTIEQLHVEGVPVGGSSATRGIYINTTVKGITVDSVKASLHQYAVYADNMADVSGWNITNATLINSGAGMQIEAKAKVAGLHVGTSAFSNNQYGMSSTADGTASNNQAGLTNVMVTGSTFSGNTVKGMYFEKLDNAGISGNTFTNNGTANTFPTGLDVNLKYGTFSNVILRENMLNTNGTGTASGGGITVKARNDGSYGSNPATLSNLTVSNNEVHGSPVGIAIGNNVIRTTAVVDSNLIDGATRGMVIYEAPDGSVTTLYHNSVAASQNTIENGDAGSSVIATCNWLGSNIPPTVMGSVSGNVSYNPWLLNGSDGAGIGFQPLASCSSRPTAVISGSDTICLGLSATLSVALTGTQPWTVTYTDGTTPVTVSGITASPYTFNVNPALTTTYTLTAVSDANYPAEAGDMTGSAVVTVNVPATAGISYAGTPFCALSAGEPVTLNGTGTYTGGTFSSTSGLSVDAVTGNIVPASSTAGTYVVTYTLPASSSCPVYTTTDTVEVKAPVSGYITGSATVVQNSSSTPNITFVGTGGTAPYTFTYSVNNGSVQTVSTSVGSSVTTVPQSNSTLGDYVYTLLSVTDAGNCAGMLPGDNKDTIKVVANVPVANLTPVVVVPNPSFTPTDTVRSFYISVYNIGTIPSSGTISLYVLKPANPGATITFDPAWTVTESPTYYLVESSAVSINGNFGFVTIPGTIEIDPAVPAGTLNMQVILGTNSGGDNTPVNNSASVGLNKTN